MAEMKQVEKEMAEMKVEPKQKNIAPWIIPPLTSLPHQRVSDLTPEIDNLQHRPRQDNLVQSVFDAFVGFGWVCSMR